MHSIMDGEALDYSGEPLNIRIVLLGESQPQVPLTKIQNRGDKNKPSGQKPNIALDSDS